ncbi:Uncharacterised protein [Streptococcus pneumoniae]|nr:Uncharacterised protein [Streptococcus pneumoniae]
MLTKLNCHSGMVKIPANLQKTLKMVALQQLVSIQQGASFAELEKSMKDNIVYTQKTLLRI